MAPLSLQRKLGALWIRAPGDPGAIGQFQRAFEDLTAAGLHALDGGADVLDIEVKKPERERLRRPLRAHATNCQPTSREQLICVGVTDFGVRLLPAENLAVERKHLLPIVGMQFMPAHTPRLAELGGYLPGRLQPVDQSKCCSLRIGDNRNKADIGVGRWDINGATEAL